MAANDYIAFAHQLADAAGEAIRPYFGVAVDVQTKADNSPVSIADRAAEHAIRVLIEKQYPDHGIYGEEFGSSFVIPAEAGIPLQKGDSRFRGNDSIYTWVIDPIDGTRAFLAGKKEWGTLIALCENGIPILGILNQPITGERWVGVRDGIATFSIGGAREEPITHGCPSLSAARISTTSKNYFTPIQARNFATLAEHCKMVIEDGDCYAYGLLARGERDLVVDAGLKPYDILALVPIIEAAGGTITTWDGAPVTLTNFANVLAAGDVALHKEALSFLHAA